MPAEPTNVVEDVVEPQVEEPVSPAEPVEPQEPEEPEDGTPQEPEAPVEPEEQTVPYERFKQVNDERKQLLELVQRQPPQPVQQPQQPAVDPNAGMSPEEQVFYNNLDKRTQTVVDRVIKGKEDQFNQAIGQMQLMVGKVLTKQFRKDHPDIKPDSEEELLISKKVGEGHDAEDAYKIVMFDSQQQTATVKVKQQQKQQRQVKKQANVEVSSTPPNSGLPRKKTGWKETAGKLFDEEVSKGWEG